jgi:hypothetical protein
MHIYMQKKIGKVINAITIDQNKRLYNQMTILTQMRDLFTTQTE